jgi:hypothetical protein
VQIGIIEVELCAVAAALHYAINKAVRVIAFASELPELTPYIQFTHEDRAQILDHFNKIFAITERRRDEAKVARYTDLIHSHRARIINGKASPVTN